MIVHKMGGWLLAVLAALLVAGAPAMAQGGKEEQRAEAERQVKAKRDADMLRDQAARNNGETLRATVPADPDNIWVLTLSNGQRVRIQLRPDVAPAAVERIKALTRQDFYDGLKFHRVIPGFMAQGGDPSGDGTGGSSLPDLPAEFNWLPHMRGSVAMARSADPDSANSQFYIMLMPRFQLDKKYTVFGRVIEGMDGVDAIATGEPPARPTTIVNAWIEADGPAPAGG